MGELEEQSNAADKEVRKLSDDTTENVEQDPTQSEGIMVDDWAPSDSQTESDIKEVVSEPVPCAGVTQLEPSSMTQLEDAGDDGVQSESTSVTDESSFKAQELESTFLYCKLLKERESRTDVSERVEGPFEQIDDLHHKNAETEAQDDKIQTAEKPVEKSIFEDPAQSYEVVEKQIDESPKLEIVETSVVKSDLMETSLDQVEPAEVFVEQTATDESPGADIDASIGISPSADTNDEPLHQDEEEVIEKASFDKLAHSEVVDTTPIDRPGEPFEASLDEKRIEDDKAIPIVELLEQEVDTAPVDQLDLHSVNTSVDQAQDVAEEGSAKDVPDADKEHVMSEEQAEQAKEVQDEQILQIQDGIEEEEKFETGEEIVEQYDEAKISAEMVQETEEIIDKVSSDIHRDTFVVEDDTINEVTDFTSEVVERVESDDYVYADSQADLANVKEKEPDTYPIGFEPTPVSQSEIKDSDAEEDETINEITELVSEIAEPAQNAQEYESEARIEEMSKEIETETIYHEASHDYEFEHFSSEPVMDFGEVKNEQEPKTEEEVDLSISEREDKLEAADFELQQAETSEVQMSIEDSTEFDQESIPSDVKESNDYEAQEIEYVTKEDVTSELFDMLSEPVDVLSKITERTEPVTTDEFGVSYSEAPIDDTCAESEVYSLTPETDLDVQATPSLEQEVSKSNAGMDIQGLTHQKQELEVSAQVMPSTKPESEAKVDTHDTSDQSDVPQPCVDSQDSDRVPQQPEGELESQDIPYEDQGLEAEDDAKDDSLCQDLEESKPDAQPVCEVSEPDVTPLPSQEPEVQQHEAEEDVPFESVQELEFRETEPDAQDLPRQEPELKVQEEHEPEAELEDQDLPEGLKTEQDVHIIHDQALDETKELTIEVAELDMSFEEHELKNTEVEVEIEDMPCQESDVDENVKPDTEFDDEYIPHQEPESYESRELKSETQQEDEAYYQKSEVQEYITEEGGQEVIDAQPEVKESEVEVDMSCQDSEIQDAEADLSQAQDLPCQDDVVSRTDDQVSEIEEEEEDVYDLTGEELPKKVQDIQFSSTQHTEYTEVKTDEHQERLEIDYAFDAESGKSSESFDMPSVKESRHDVIEDVIDEPSIVPVKSEKITSSYGITDEWTRVDVESSKHETTTESTEEDDAAHMSELMTETDSMYMSTALETEADRGHESSPDVAGEAVLERSFATVEALGYILKERVDVEETVMQSSVHSDIGFEKSERESQEKVVSAQSEESQVTHEISDQERIETEQQDGTYHVIENEQDHPEQAEPIASDLEEHVSSSIQSPVEREMFSFAPEDDICLVTPCPDEVDEQEELRDEKDREDAVSDDLEEMDYKKTDQLDDDQQEPIVDKKAEMTTEVDKQICAATEHPQVMDQTVGMVTLTESFDPIVDIDRLVVAVNRSRLSPQIAKLVTPVFQTKSEFDR